MEQITLSTVQYISTLLFDSLPKSLGSAALYSNDRFHANSAFIVREDNGNPRTLVNVFDKADGQKCFTISRKGLASTIWHVYAEPEHIEVASITIGLFTRRADKVYGGSTVLKYGSGLFGKFHRHFYDQQGNQFSWNRRSKFLERIINPAGGREEHRERVASVDKLRGNRFDWEVQVNTDQVDVLRALTTAFITMRTQWPSGDVTHPIHPSATETEKDQPEYALEFAGNNPDKLQVYAPEEPSKEPLNFFNPPEFLEHKYN